MLRHRRKRPEIQTPEIFHIFVLRKIDVYQYRLLTSIITVKQAYNPLNRSAGNADRWLPVKQPETLFGFFAVLLRGSILRAATMMVVTAGTATGVVTVMRNRARRDNSRNRVLVNHLADRVFQQDHELIKRLDLPLQLNTIHQINRNWNTFPTQCVQERIL